jgi:hypothetical protein
MLSEVVVTPIGIGLVFAGVGLGIAGGATFIVLYPAVYGTKHCISHLKERARLRRIEQQRLSALERIRVPLKVDRIGRLILQHGVTVFLNFSMDDYRWASLLRTLTHLNESDGVYCTIIQINGVCTRLRFVPTDFQGELFWYNEDSPTVSSSVIQTACL